MQEKDYRMLPWLGTFTVTPWLAIFGAIAILSPIIIHLLNKRKFKIVDWAAMEFLLDADKRNRRRVRLENFLLLLLRCLAVFLLGLMLAQPFLPSGFTAGILDSTEFEHIVVLDDSLSTQVQAGSQSAFEDAKQRLNELLAGLEDDENADTFTLILTSQPDQRQANGIDIEDHFEELKEQITKLEPSDKAADFATLLTTLEQEVKSQPKNVNRLVYLVTDLRKRDWVTEGRETSENDPAKAVERISKATNGVYILDIGNQDYKNLMITDIRPEGVLVAGVQSRFDVTIANFSTTEARDVTVKFKASEALPLEHPIDRIAAGQSATVPFSFTFSVPEELGDDGLPKPIEPVRIEVQVASARPAEEDRLLADSIAYFPARVVRGIPTLIVDGDPSSDELRSESVFLRHALEPTGPVLSGVAAEVVHEAELETMSFSQYQVIFLCNVYEFSDKVQKDLEAWVRRGGGLVIMPGDHVNETIYNKALFKDGNGLSPVRLDNIHGDETEEKWVQFQVEVDNHPVLGVFEGQNNPALEMAKTFRWWSTSNPKGQIGKSVSVAARFNDPEQSIAMAEKKFGEGRVFFTAIPADADWHIWPIYGTYVIAMQELVRHQAGDVAGSGGLRAGEPVIHTIDLSEYKTDGEIRAPREKKANLQAREPGSAVVKGETLAPIAGDDKKKSSTPTPAPAPGATGEKAESQTQWQMVYDQTALRGFYELGLSRNDGTEEKLLFAVNADPTEGDLSRVDEDELRKELGDRVKIMKARDAATLAGAGAQREVWTTVLLAVAGVLMLEQFLGWVFGWRR